MLLVFISLSLCCVFAQGGAYSSRGNPIITHKFTSDPAALVYKDKVYLYTGHDAPSRFGNNPQEWLVFSSGDFHTWQEYPVPLKKDDFEWAANKDNTWAWAAHVAERDGKFYMYASIADPINRTMSIGVAVSDSPSGPFKDAIGKPLVSGNMHTVDPAVFIENDGQAYIFWGCYGSCFYAKLKDNMVELDSPAMQVRIESMLDEQGFIDLEGFWASAWVHKHDDWYYLSYSSGGPAKIMYAMSKNINGPWIYKGLLNEVPGNVANNHQAIIDYKGKNYFFYYNGVLPNGGNFSRSVCVDYLYYNPDGTMKKVWMTTEGVSDNN